MCCSNVCSEVKVTRLEGPSGLDCCRIACYRIMFEKKPVGTLAYHTLCSPDCLQRVQQQIHPLLALHSTQQQAPHPQQVAGVKCKHTSPTALGTNRPKSHLQVLCSRAALQCFQELLPQRLWHLKLFRLARVFVRQPPQPRQHTVQHHSILCTQSIPGSQWARQPRAVASTLWIFPRRGP